MSTHRKTISVRTDPELDAQIAWLRDRTQERNPDVTISEAVVVRLAIGRAYQQEREAADDGHRGGGAGG